MAHSYLLEIGLEEMPAHVVTPSIKQLHERALTLQRFKNLPRRVAWLF